MYFCFLSIIFFFGPSNNIYLTIRDLVDMCLYWVPIYNHSSSQESKYVRPGRKKARMIEYAVKCVCFFAKWTNMSSLLYA